MFFTLGPIEIKITTIFFFPEMVVSENPPQHQILQKELQHLLALQEVGSSGEIFVAFWGCLEDPRHSCAFYYFISLFPAGIVGFALRLAGLPAGKWVC